MADEKDITTNDDISIEFVEHPEGESRPEPEPEPVMPPARTAQGKKPEPEAEEDGETAEKLRLAEDRLLRLRADFENYKKRVDRDNAELQVRSQMEVLRMLLPFLDNMERAFDNIPEQLGGSYIEGLELSLKDLENGMRTFGLEEVPALGVQFDPAHHESLGFESDDEKEDNEVLKVWEKGYLFKGKLLRPAKVFINRKSAAKTASENVKENDNG
ncbi:MAG TPA: nucleotide exchange factor GrpE [Acidobacteriota bacterium]|nr:nucleotide exchange factor GrpE [Acidobacteriota bacterium]HQO19063.1 nucleotide exchange factor GrpE [Acidobacteriota bacterium]HQQ45956.1 nucleotide exchange factor GrpE [Acidobacteriota bacterium]